MSTLALITGASAGFGYELAKVSAAHGCDLILSARDATRLERAAAQLRAAYPVGIETVAQDLSESGAAARLFEALGPRAGGIGILMNNAGFGYHGYFVDQPEAQLDGLLMTNVVALTELTRLVLPGMREQRRGRILNVASIAAFAPGPIMTVYHASKSYVVAFTEALAVELEGSGVTATVVCPGPMKTGFQERAGIAGERMLRSPLVMDVGRAAAIGYRAMLSGKTVCVPGTINAAAAFLSLHAPRKISARAARRIQRPR
jgi:short-subunit dehydrogenase